MLHVLPKIALVLIIVLSISLQLNAGSKSATPTQKELESAIPVEEYQCTIQELRELMNKKMRELGEVANQDTFYFLQHGLHRPEVERKRKEIEAQMEEITRLIRIKEGYEQE